MKLRGISVEGLKRIAQISDSEKTDLLIDEVDELISLLEVLESTVNEIQSNKKHITLNSDQEQMIFDVRNSVRRMSEVLAS